MLTIRAVRTVLSPLASLISLRLKFRSMSISKYSKSIGNSNIYSKTSHQLQQERLFSNKIEETFENLAEDLLVRLESALDKVSLQLNPEEISSAYGVLTIDLGKRGTWVINKQSPNQEIWWSSPKSGPRRFSYNSKTKEWHWTRDENVTLVHLLTSEISEVAPGVKLSVGGR